jgi:pimeloyl-ACP methyl ester carboxylesterase
MILLAIIQRLMAILSLALLVAGGYLLWSWWRWREALDPSLGQDLNDQAWRLWVGGALIVFSLLGRAPLGLLLGRKGDDGGRLRRDSGAQVETPDGAVLHVESSGPEDAPVLVFVHGWGMSTASWWEARRMLAERFQVVTYDLAGLGRSKGPRDGRYSLDRFADDLMVVVSGAGRRKVVLVGHSIGGMILQTFCRRYPQALGSQVAGIVLENTTHTDPSRTTILGGALQAMKPVLSPLMRLDVWLQPLVWLMNWQSYLSGSTHLGMRLGGFGTRPTRAQLEQVSLDATRNSPAVQAKGNLAMMHWSATEDLPSIRIPALVFIGGRDLVTRPSAGETIVERLPAARPCRVERAGHMGPQECAEVYNAAISRFADEVFTRGAQYADAPRPAGTQRPPGADGKGSGDEARPVT